MDDDDGGRNDTQQRRREIKTSEVFDIPKLSAFKCLSTQRRGDNKKRCGKESPTMVIEGDEANKFNTILSFPISHAMMGNDKNRAERNAHHDDGGGETFRLRI